MTPPCHLLPAAPPVADGSASRHVDIGRAERAVRELLIALGEDPTRDGLRETPARVARSLVEMTSGAREDVAQHLARQFDEASDELVVVRDIGFHSLCEHHLLPFSGRVHLAYLPAHGKVVGLSKLSRTVEVFARRLQLQERMTREIADALAEQLGAAAVGVLVESTHLCMSVRGVRQGEASMTTTAWRGRWKVDSHRRAEIAPLLRGHG